MTCFDHLVQHFKRINKRRNKAIVWVWAMVFLSMGIFTVVWTTCGVVFQKYMDMIDATFGSLFVGQARTTFNNIATTFYYLPVIVLWSLIGWGVINSMRRESISEPL